MSSSSANNPAAVDLVLTFRASTTTNKSKSQGKKEEAQEAETQYLSLLDVLQKAGFRAVGRRGKELGHLLVLVQCPERVLQDLLKQERASDFLSGLPSKLDAPLTPSDRIRLIHTYITSVSDDGGLGIVSGTKPWTRVESIMALHDTEYNERWIHAWTHSRSPSGHENSLRDMFGESVALYFTFLQSYTYALVPPAILGASFFFFNLSYSPIYSTFILLWAIAYVEWWRIYERLVALRFGSLGHFRVEKKRKREEGKVQWWQRELRIVAGIPVILAFAGILSVLISAIFVFEAFLTQLYTGPLHEYVGFTPTVLFMLIVPSFISVYEAFAKRFTDWENHAHESTHMRSLTLKTFAVSSLVKYLGLALSAFVYVPFGEVVSHWIVLNVGGGEGGEGEMRKLVLNPARLKDQMFAFTVTQQAVGTFLEIGMPFVMRLVSKWRGGATNTTSEGNKVNGKGGRKVQFEDEKPRGGEEEQKLLDRVREEAGLPAYDVFTDYNEMASQFGYVVLWSTIWPLAPLMALINNIFEIRSDAFKITVHTRRPMPVRTDTIGPWLDVLDILTWVGAMTNAVLVYLFCPREYDQCASSPVEKVQMQMHLRVRDPSSDPSQIMPGKPDGAQWELFMMVLLIALGASHAHRVAKKLTRHALEKVVWGHSDEVKEKEARQRGYLKKVFEQSEVKSIVDHVDIEEKEGEGEFWKYDEGVDEIGRLSKEA